MAPEGELLSQVYRGILVLDVDDNKTLTVPRNERYIVVDFANLKLLVWIKIEKIYVNIRYVRTIEEMETNISLDYRFRQMTETSR